MKLLSDVLLGNGSCNSILLYELGGYWATKTIPKSIDGWCKPTQAINCNDTVHGNESFIILFDMFEVYNNVSIAINFLF